MSRRSLVAFAAGAVMATGLQAAHAAPVTAENATITLTAGGGDLSLGAVGDAQMTADGGVLLSMTGAADSLVSTSPFGAADVGTGISLETDDGVLVALTDFTIDDGMMFGRITARGMDGADGLLMFGTTELFAIEDAGGSFDLRVETVAGQVLADLLGVDFGGQVIARLDPAAAPAVPLPGAMLFFLTGAGAVALRRARG